MILRIFERMIYLLLDTNIWIYLANGFDANSQKFHDNHHFTLLARLTELSEDEDICVLVNEVIIKEWHRNKGSAERKIEQLKKKLLNMASFHDIEKYVKTSLTDIKKEYKQALEDEIAANQKHLKDLEIFLINNCQSIPLEDQIKIKVFEYANEKKAPFHNNKNNFADAAILFSLQSFFENHMWRFGETVLFVSNNTDEFTDSKDLNSFHPDIKLQLGTCPIQYCTKLPDALNLSKEIILEIDAYNKNKKRSDTVNCENTFCRYGEIELDQDMQVIYEIEEEKDPDQLILFPKLINRARRAFVDYNWCPSCETLYLQCPKCLESICRNEPDSHCKTCGTVITVFENPNSGNFAVYVYNEYTSEKTLHDGVW